jgi:hypothetical protein
MRYSRPIQKQAKYFNRATSPGMRSTGSWLWTLSRLTTARQKSEWSLKRPSSTVTSLKRFSEASRRANYRFDLLTLILTYENI